MSMEAQVDRDPAHARSELPAKVAPRVTHVLAFPSPRTPVRPQRLGYAGLLGAFYNEPWYLGTYLWMWRADSSAGGTADDSFTPAGKPAVSVLHHYWT